MSETGTHRPHRYVHSAETRSCSVDCSAGTRIRARAPSRSAGSSTASGRRTRSGGHVQRYVMELYLPRSRALEAGATGHRARAAAAALAHEGLPIRYIRTTYLPDDETCFHVFEAGSIDIVGEAGRRAALGRVRVVPAVESSGPQ